MRPNVSCSVEVPYDGRRDEKELELTPETSGAWLIKFTAA